MWHGGHHVTAPISCQSYDPRCKFWQARQRSVIFDPCPLWRRSWAPVKTVWRRCWWRICHVIWDPITWQPPVSGPFVVAPVISGAIVRWRRNCVTSMLRSLQVVDNSALFPVDKPALSVDDRWLPHQESLVTHHHCFVTLNLRQTGK